MIKEATNADLWTMF